MCAIPVRDNGDRLHGPAAPRHQPRGAAPDAVARGARQGVSAGVRQQAGKHSIVCINLRQLIRVLTKSTFYIRSSFVSFTFTL